MRQVQILKYALRGIMIQMERELSQSRLNNLEKDYDVVTGLIFKEEQRELDLCNKIMHLADVIPSTTTYSEMFELITSTLSE